MTSGWEYRYAQLASRPPSAHPTAHELREQVLRLLYIARAVPESAETVLRVAELVRRQARRLAS